MADRKYIPRNINGLLLEAFEFAELQNICDFEFEEFYQEHRQEIDIKALVRSLIKYCQTNDLFSDLLEIVEVDKPEIYATYKGRLWRGGKSDETPADTSGATRLGRRAKRVDKNKALAAYEKSWALVVGIDKYTEHTPLANARSDAAAMAEVLSSKYGFEVTTLYDEQATRKAILRWLRGFIRRSAKKNDRVIFFFAGHGTSLKNTGANKAYTAGYLVPVEAEENEHGDYIDMDEIRKAAGLVPAKHMLFILDCCFSGVAAVATRSTLPARDDILDDTYFQRITQRDARQVLTAGADDELAADYGSRVGHSALTSALLDGLVDGQADLDGDGIITASELSQFVKPRVNRATATPHRAGQTPFFAHMGGGMGDFVFVLPEPGEVGSSVTAKLTPTAKAGPSMVCTLSAEPQVVKTGDDVTWTCEIHNNGNEPLDRIRVRHGGKVLASRVALEAAEKKSFPFTTTYKGQESQGEQTEKVSISAITSKNRSLRDEVEATIRVKARPSMACTLSPEAETGEVGGEVSWRVEIHNDGDALLQEVIVEHNFSELAMPFELAPAAAETLTFKTPSPAVGQHRETVTVEAVADEGSFLDEELEATVQIVKPAMTATLSAEPETVEAGAEVVWTIVVHNAGETILKDVTVVLRPSAEGMIPIAKPFKLGLDETKTLTFETIPQAGGQHREQVTISAVTPSDNRVTKDVEATIQVTPRSSPKSSPKTLTLTSPINMEFVLVPAGEFLMGSDPAKDKYARDNEQPQHTLTLPDYYIAKYPVTNAQYAAFVQATNHKAHDKWWQGGFPSGDKDHPAVYVSWDDAVAFCRWLSGQSNQLIRLPSEAEWEKAARGPEGLIYPWPDQLATAKLCNFNRNVGETTSVGNYSPKGDSPYGAVDMAGNVWEWCATEAPDYEVKPYPYNIKEDEWAEEYLNGTNVQVLRGGSWGDHGPDVRCACRGWDLSDLRSNYDGMRCVVSPI